MATTVAFGSNLVVDEGGGNVYLVVNRTGDLTGTTLVVVDEDWSRSSAETDDVIFNPYVAGASIVYLPDTRQVLLKFNPGVKTLKIPYSISNDIVSELSERLYFSLSYITPVIIGDDDANIKINASDPVLSIHGLWVDEGQTTNSYIELSHAVNFAVTVKVSTYFGTYKQANYLGEGKDYKGLVDQLVTIPAGQTKAYVPFLTYQNDDPNDWKYESTEIRIEATSIPNGVLAGQISDVVTIIDVATPPPPPTLPILTLYDGGLAFENESTRSYAELSQPVDHDVTFKVSTYFGTYQQANYLGEAGDYDGLIDKLFTIQAGQTRVDIPVQINQNPDPEDWEYEAFELRIEASTISGATLGVGSVIINIKDVSTWVEPPPPTVTPLTATMLENHKQAFLNLESEVGTSSAVTVIENDSFLLRLAKTLEGLGQLPLSLIQAGLSLTATTAYASEEELPRSELVDLVAGRVGSNYPFLTSIQLLEALSPKEWTSIDIAFVGDKYLRVGDYVDGRLVIAQPWMALKANGSYVSSSSSQGRDGGDNFSHKNLLQNSFDWSGVSKYPVVPYEAKVIDYDDSGDIGSFNNGLGNFVTLKLDIEGKTIYLTFAHLKQYSVTDKIKQAKNDGSVIPIGTIIGETGQTGVAENPAYPEYAPYGYAVHLHMQAGTSLETEYGDSRYADANTDDVPPVYMMGFRKEDVITLSALGDEDPAGIFSVQDYGFPIGYNGGHIAENILPTIPISDFYIANPTFTTINVEQGDSGDNHFIGDSGDDMYLGKGGYDQVDYFGSTSNRSNFTVTQNPDGTIKVVSAEFGTDTLDNIEGVWLDNQFKWYTIENLLNPIKTYFTTASKPVLEGTSAEEIFIGDGNVNWFIGNGGGDTYNGHGEYDQVEYYGANAYRSNFIFSKNLDNSVSVASPYGAETYNSIEGVYFGTEEKWYAVDSLIFI